MSFTQHLRAALEAQLGGVADAQRRKAAFAAFEDLGLPTRRDEEWRYTPLAALSGHRWGAPRAQSLRPDELARHQTPGAVARFVFVDGSLHAAASRLEPVAGLTLSHLRADAAGRPQVAEADLVGDLERPRSGVDALHEALAFDGAIIEVAANTELEGVIEIVHVAADPESVAAHRHIVRLGHHARATLVERYVATSEAAAAAFLRVNGTTIDVGAGAALHHIRLQREARGACAFYADDVATRRDGAYRRVTVSLGARVARETLTIRVNEPGAHTDIAALYVPKQGQLIDHHTCIDHRAPACTADQLYKGILDGDGAAVFNGKIFVRQAAQQTAAEQLNQNLMLSRDATCDTKPQLEIFADDVRCTHGATVGQLSPEEMFYLMSRAIPEPAARRMLVHGFAETVLERVAAEDVARELREQLDEHLAA